VPFTVPAHLDRFWSLDAAWGLLNPAAQELLRAAAGNHPVFVEKSAN
jgi:hypothetical protein